MQLGMSFSVFFLGYHGIAAGDSRRWRCMFSGSRCDAMVMHGWPSGRRCDAMRSVQRAPRDATRCDAPRCSCRAARAPTMRCQAISCHRRCQAISCWLAGWLAGGCPRLPQAVPGCSRLPHELPQAAPDCHPETPKTTMEPQRRPKSDAETPQTSPRLSEGTRKAQVNGRKSTERDTETNLKNSRFSREGDPFFEA